jgi:Right handed beta helix region
MVAVVVVLSCSTACADKDPHDAVDGSPGTMADASQADASTPDASLPDAGLSDGGPSDGGPSDGGPSDAGPTGPSIDSVTTADGFGEVRQGATVEIVVRGSGLAEVDAVAVGELAAVVLGTAADEVRAELVVPHGTAPGPREVSVSGPGRSASLADALSTTLYVVAPGAPPGGRGTFESPLSLCDPETVTAEAGDTISLLAGEHACDGENAIAFRRGVTLAGAGPDATLVRGATASFPGFDLASFGEPVGAPTAARGFTVVASQPVQGPVFVVSGPGPLAVEDLRVEGPGFRLGGMNATVTRLEVDCGGPAFGLAEEIPANVTVTDSRFTDCNIGVGVSGGTWSVTGSTFERNDLGISGDRGFGVQGDLTIAGCELDDNTTGMRFFYSDAEVTDTAIRDSEVTPQSMQTGILVGTGGSLQLTGGEISGHDGTGVSVFASVEGPSFVVSITDALIVGGRIGVDADGRDNPNSLTMRDSVVRDQTVASVRIFVEWFFVTLDLGNGGGPGGNELSVVSGIALLDIREEPDEFNRTIDATGITLNGRSYAGQLIEGPVSLPPDYEIRTDGLIQF